MCQSHHQEGRSFLSLSFSFSLPFLILIIKQLHVSIPTYEMEISKLTQIKKIKPNPQNIGHKTKKAIKSIQTNEHKQQ